MTVTHQTGGGGGGVYDLTTRFRVTGNAFSFHRQYSKIYSARLAHARPRLLDAVSKRWNAVVLTAPDPDSLSVESKEDKTDLTVCSLNNLITGARCVIIGIIYKEMKLKPSILREIAASDSGENKIQILNDVKGLLSPDDVVYLEDEIQRISIVIDQDRIATPLLTTNLVTGVAVALLGYEPENDLESFHVENALFLEPTPSRTIGPLDTHLPINSLSANDGVQFSTNGPWLALVSGLGFTGSGTTKPGHAMALELLGDWLRCAGDWKSDRLDTSGVVRLMILGDSITSASDVEGSGTGSFCQQARYLTRNTEANSVNAMSHLDAWLAALPLAPRGVDNSIDAETVTVNDGGLEVDLLPGSADPTSQLLPQQPLHAAAFPLAAVRSGGGAPGRTCLFGRTNPFMCRLMDRTVLATSGQGVNDLELYTDLPDPLDRIEATLLWGHLAPTCPDTLPCYPLLAQDPLLLSPDSIDYPDIYAVGCQPTSEGASWRRSVLHWDERATTKSPSHSAAGEGALLIAVPRFSTSFSIILVHLVTLECRRVRFSVEHLDCL